MNLDDVLNSNNISNDVRELTKEQYDELYKRLDDLLNELYSKNTGEDVLKEIMFQRANFLVKNIFKFYSIDFDEAMDLIRNQDGNLLTEKQTQERNILMSAMDNMVDFALASEYQMYNNLPAPDDYDEYEIFYEDSKKVFDKYNSRYAVVENSDIKHAMEIAAAWVVAEEFSTVTFCTQADEKVRPSHQDLEGLSYPKADFPSSLIPPIDHCCRCYLDISPNAIATGVAAGLILDHINPIFKESVVHGGAIFSSEHPYFEVEGEDSEWLEEYSEEIKQIIYGN